MKKISLFALLFLISTFAFSITYESAEGTVTTRDFQQYRLSQTRKNGSLIKAVYSKKDGGDISQAEISAILSGNGSAWKKTGSSTWINQDGYKANHFSGIFSIDFKPSKNQIENVDFAKLFGIEKKEPIRTISNRKNYIGVGQTVTQALQKYGAPTSKMISDSTSVLIFKTREGTITQKFNEKGICISSTIEDPISQTKTHTKPSSINQTANNFFTKQIKEIENSYNLELSRQKQRELQLEKEIKEATKQIEFVVTCWLIGTAVFFLATLILIIVLIRFLIKKTKQIDELKKEKEAWLETMAKTSKQEPVYDENDHRRWMPKN